MDSWSNLARIRLEQDTLNQHFKCYLNNKMMVLMTLIEHPELHEASQLAQRERISIQDIYHHFLPKKTDLHHKHAFRWFEILLEHYPDVSVEHLKKGHKMLDLIEEVFTGVK